MLSKILSVASLFLVFASTASWCDATPSGVMEGHLKILSPKPVDIGDENATTATATNYADYPLLILTRGEKKEVAQITADANGNYHVELPAGDYVLDVPGRTRKHVRAKPQPFTVVSNKTVRVDMVIDTDHWRAKANQ